MYRKSIYSVAVYGCYAFEMFIVAAITGVEAAAFVKDYIKEHSSELYDFEPTDVEDSNVKRVAVDASVDHDGVLYHAGYAE